MSLFGENNLIEASPGLYESLGFPEDDVSVVREFGLPEWAAPNIFLMAPRYFGGGVFKIGEDRLDRAILYNLKDSEIVVGEGLYFASGFRQMLHFLSLYAVMVEKSLDENGRQAFVDNNLSSGSIDSFETACHKALGEKLWGGSFWREEVSRLRAGVR